MRPKKLLGSEGEAYAARFLKSRGYRIIERNYAGRLGEIDIIARHRREMVFIEVKLRSTEELGSPEEAVGPRKLAHMRRCAQEYLSFHRIEPPCRFEIVSILKDPRHGEFLCEIIPAD